MFYHHYKLAYTLDLKLRKLIQFYFDQDMKKIIIFHLTFINLINSYDKFLFS